MDAQTLAQEPADAGDPLHHPDFDAAQVQDLASVLPAEQVLVLARSYRETVDSILAQIGDAASAQDFTTIKEQAHDLKSASGSFGARRLQHIAEDLEHACARGEHPDMAVILPAMQETATAAWCAIEAHLAA